MSEAYIHTFASMGTVVTIHVVGSGEPAIARAAAWFARVEECCSRFDPGSEVSQLTARSGEPVRVSDLLFQAVQFALAVARASRGAFDPTVGQRMETRGFNREYRTGQIVHTSFATTAVSYRDVRLDAAHQTITLVRPLVLDLGAVAKGLAVDLAARELQPLGNFAIDAGGDLYLGGHSAAGKRWSVGIRHPRDPAQLIHSLQVSDVAICTSGDYEQRSPRVETDHHIIDARTGTSPSDVASVTVLAPTAMVADALSTAAFVLGPKAGLELLRRQGVEGLIVTTALEQLATPGLGARP